MVRLQKYLAECGLGSRRKCEEFIGTGLVKVNGDIVTELGTKVDPLVDKIEFKDAIINLKPQKKVYLMLNKPIGYVTTVSDEKNRSTVMDLLKGINERIVPVGRLDMYTSGLLLFSNDGDFINKVTHPSHEIAKTYVVKTRGIPSEEDLEKLRSGVRIDDYVTSPAKVEVLLRDNTNNVARLKIEIHEGRNREVRKMVESVGLSTIALRREAIGNLTLEGVERGKWRYLTSDEVKQLIED
ncbi:MAG: rRNA pseudouridine synthase [Clostridia bacterium]|nr:rRNA pseudouridine synthase [Clostridia bacterium]